MKKFLISFFVFVTILFLFGGLLLVGAFSTTTNGEKELSTVGTSDVRYPDDMAKKMSMKQIDSLSSVYNLSFTAANAVKSNPQSAIQ